MPEEFHGQEKSDGLLSTGWTAVRHDWATFTHPHSTYGIQSTWEKRSSRNTFCKWFWWVELDWKLGSASLDEDEQQGWNDTLRWEGKDLHSTIRVIHINLSRYTHLKMHKNIRKSLLSAKLCKNGESKCPREDWLNWLRPILFSKIGQDKEKHEAELCVLSWQILWRTVSGSDMQSSKYNVRPFVQSWGRMCVC